MRPTIRPYRKGIENGMSRSAQCSRKFENGVPLSSGCAELAL